jgi:tripartite-type tricarboxylate transporter receptor subunit TctC
MAGLVGSVSHATAAMWKPQKPVQFIIMAGAGGGADQIARLIQGLIEKEKLAPVPFIPINKPGGSGAEALRYMKDHAGDNYTLLVTLNSFYTTPLIQKNLGVDITKFTPIGRMALDTFLLWQREDSPVKTLDGWAKMVKSKKKYVVGGTGSGQEDSILFAMIENEFDIKNITYVPFPGGGTVAKNLIGGHIDATVNNPSEQIEFYRAGKSKPIVAFTDKRLPAFPKVPTAKEEGHDLVYYMQRSINGPPGMSKDAQAYYIDLFHKVYESAQWQKFCTDEGLDCKDWVAGDALAKFHMAQLKRHEELIAKVGAAAITGQ